MLLRAVSALNWVVFEKSTAMPAGLLPAWFGVKTPAVTVPGTQPVTVMLVWPATPPMLCNLPEESKTTATGTGSVAAGGTVGGTVAIVGAVPFGLRPSINE